ncbi:type II secretion system protein, partial [Reyranella sp.]|uniref:type II secretion system protein n=1 Tax=Reyranella sp. TaxID=1929291 RepID=UPI00271B7276
PAQPAGILLGLLLPAVQKLGEAPQPTTVEHAFPRSVLASKRELQIDIVIPDGGGSPKVDWGDGSPLTDVGRDGVPAPSGLVHSSSSDFKDRPSLRVSALSSSQAGSGGPGTPTANEAAISTSRDNIKKPPPPAMLPDVGVTATGPNGTQQLRSDGGGWTRLGKLAVGNTVIEFSGTDLASALTKTGTPTTPIPQKTLIELLVVIAIIAVNTDGTPVVFTRSMPASDVKTVTADLRIGRNGNAMTVDWGNGLQLPQVLPRTGTATLTVPGPNGPIPLDPAFVKSLQDRAGGSAPGLVDANAAIGPAATTR